VFAAFLFSSLVPDFAVEVKKAEVGMATSAIPTSAFNFGFTPFRRSA
jgi:hypothetical protein